MYHIYTTKDFFYYKGLLRPSINLFYRGTKISTLLLRKDMLKKRLVLRHKQGIENSLFVTQPCFLVSL